MSPAMFCLTLPLRVVSVMNAREHWAERARRAKSHRHTTSLVLSARLPGKRALRERLASNGRVQVELVRIGPRKLDGDNLQAALKAVRDGVADVLKVDDGSELVSWVYGQRSGKFGVEIRIGVIE